MKFQWFLSGFEIGNIASFVTPKVFEESDLELFDELDEVYSKVNTLQSSSIQLENGASALKDGADTFYEKSQEFNGAMKKVSDGANSASSNYAKINDGIDTLNKSSHDLSDGAKKVSDGTEAISSALGDVKTGVSNLKTGTLKLKAGVDKINASVSGLLGDTDTQGSTRASVSMEDKLKALISGTQKAMADLKKANADLQAPITALGNEINEYKEKLKLLDPSSPDYAALNTQIQGLETQKEKLTDAIKPSLEANDGIYAALNNSLTTYADIAKLLSDSSVLSGLATLPEGLNQLSDGAAGLLDGEEKLQTGVNTLASKSKELSSGAKDLYEGTKKLTDGTQELSDGSSQMQSGLDTLSSGSASLLDANNQLTDGASSLSNGANTLASGVSKFNKEGINPICNYINGDLKDVTVKLEKLQELANEYDNFTMLDQEAEGTVKFIMIIDSIKNTNVHKEEIIIGGKKDE